MRLAWAKSISLPAPGLPSPDPDATYADLGRATTGNELAKLETNEAAAATETSSAGRVQLTEHDWPRCTRKRRPRNTRRYAMKHAKGQESSLAATEVTTEVKVYPPCQVVAEA